MPYLGAKLSQKTLLKKTEYNSARKLVWQGNQLIVNPTKTVTFIIAGET